MLTQPIAIDIEGRAHIFKEVQPPRKSSDNTEISGVRKWECDTRICRLPAESVEGVTALLNSLKATKQRYYKHFYLHLDDCNNSTQDKRLGHSLHCCRENDCHSLLRPARTLVPHFPHLRLIVRRLYELRRLVQSMQSVESAMHNGDFDRLKQSIKDLDSTMLQLRPQSSTSASNESTSHQVTEDSVLQKFGKPLRHVTEIRDCYVTTSCDLCEQMRKDLCPLQSYLDKHGYDSHCMRDAIDMLYQHKTEEEDYFIFDVVECIEWNVFVEWIVDTKPLECNVNFPQVDNR